jgi:hypothetical protein
MKFLPTFSEDRTAQKTLLKDIAHDTVGETYIEEDPSVAEWFREFIPTSHGAAEYVRELFPSARWLRRYNLHWLAGDAIAGMFSSSSAPLLILSKSKASRLVSLSSRKPWHMLRLLGCHLPLVFTLRSQAHVCIGSLVPLGTLSLV